MAVSGRKPFDLKESLSMGSTEDFEICCDPCISDRHNAEAKGFCVNCQENLCKSCLDAHRRLRVLKHHQVEDKPRARALKSATQRDQLNKCTDVCAAHNNEIIKFFCKKHETLGCNDCVTLSHRNCHIDYIPDICTGIIKSNEFKTTLDEITEKLTQSDDFRKVANTHMATKDTYIKVTIKQIEDFQKRMNDKLNTLKNKMMQDVKLAESSFDKHVHEALSQNDGVSSELKSMKANLDTYQTAEQDVQAFTAMKQAQSRLKTINVLAFKDKLIAETRTCKFKPNEALEEMLSGSDGLGRLVNIVETQTVSSVYTLYSLAHDKDINVRTKSVKSTFYITGCDLFSPGKLVVTDCCNNNIKIVDVKKQSVVQEYTLPDRPLDVTVLPQDEVAFTLTWSSKIQILKTREQLTTLCNIKVNRWCRGIAYHHDLLYVVCWDPLSVLVLDMQGTVRRDIMLQSALNETFSLPFNITVSRNLQQMYISDRDSNMVVSLTLQGEVIAVYKNDALKDPRGITALEDGSLLVCSYKNGTIHHISADLTQGSKVAEGISFAESICYDSNGKAVYVGSYNCDKIRVFSLK